jgi:hypothetical protein
MIPKSGYRFFGLDHAQKNGYGYFLLPSVLVGELPLYCDL